MTPPSACGPSAQVGAAPAGVAQQIRAAIATSDTMKAFGLRAVDMYPFQQPKYPDDSGQRDPPCEFVSGVLELIVERCQLRPSAVAPLEGGSDQAIRQPDVLRQQRTVQVGADQVVASRALEAVLAVVAEALEHATQRLSARSQVRPAAVVLEAGEDTRPLAEVDLD